MYKIKANLKKYFFIFLLFFSLASLARAETGMPKFKNPSEFIQITIPKAVYSDAAKCGDKDEYICMNWIGDYIFGVYNYALAIVGIIATTIMMFGGFLWITAGGNAGQVGEAKNWITASLTGLLIMLTSYMILYQVNPQLTKKAQVKVLNVEGKAITTTAGGMTCSYVDTACPSGSYPNKRVDFCLAEDKAASPYKQCCCTSPSSEMCKPAAPFPGKCVDCLNCVIPTISCNGNNPCFLNNDLNEKLNTAKSSYPGFVITEPWPPTVGHLDKCHQNGTCADIDLSGESVSEVKKMYDALKNTGLSTVIYEHPSCGSATNAYSAAGILCKYYGTSVGSSFHVEN